jgi:hypothetical protein
MIADFSPHNHPTRVDAPDPRRFLEHFPGDKRSAIANWFHYAVRHGAQTPRAVCSAVWQTIQRRLEWASTPENRQFLQGCLDTLRADQAGTLAYAQSVLAYEALPYEQRQRVKAQRSLQYLSEGMRGKPATEAQHWRLRQLGYEGELPSDRAEASAAIARLLQEGR